MDGTVSELWRFPVKSMLGERYGQLAIGAEGVAGDRVAALIDVESGKVASAKRPNPWRKLLTMRASLAPEANGAAPAIMIRLEDGELLSSDARDCAAKLSAVIGRPVALARHRTAPLLLDRADPEQVAVAGFDADPDLQPIEIAAAAPGGRFVDFAPVHLITMASLARVAASAGPAESERFRANLILDVPGGAAFAENGWVGRRLAVGADVVLRMIEPTPRCAVPTLAHGSLPVNVRLTQQIGTLNRAAMSGMAAAVACLGVYAAVEAPGVVAAGDRVSLLD